MNKTEFISVFQGESRSLPLRLQTVECIPFDLTGVTDIHARFKQDNGQALIRTLNTAPPFTGGVTVVDAASGRVLVQLTSLNTAALKSGERQDFTLIIYRGSRAQVDLTGAIILAKEPGTRLNDLELTFDGVLTVEQVVNAYNETVNLEFEVYFTGNGALVPPAGDVTLAGGTDDKRIVNFHRAMTVLKPSV